MTLHGCEAFRLVLAVPSPHQSPVESEGSSLLMSLCLQEDGTLPREDLPMTETAPSVWESGASSLFPHRKTVLVAKEVISDVFIFHLQA